MKKLITRLRHYFDPPQSGRIEYQYYVRTGECNNCGKCCSGIYLVHHEEVIKTVEQFDRLKAQHEDYRHFIPVEENESGVQFRCSNLTPENTCGIYNDRPQFCKKYPSEGTLLMGGGLAPEWSYIFQAKHTFSELLAQTAEKKNLQPGILLNDVTASGVSPLH
jgi:Fe-S-cluster containining protein